MHHKTLLRGKHEAMHYSSQIQHFTTVQSKHLPQFGNIQHCRNKIYLNTKKRLQKYTAASSDGSMVNYGGKRFQSLSIAASNGHTTMGGGETESLGFCDLKQAYCSSPG
jgi:hypothetical protein